MTKRERESLKAEWILDTVNTMTVLVSEFVEVITGATTDSKSSAATGAVPPAGKYGAAYQSSLRAAAKVLVMLTRPSRKLVTQGEQVSEAAMAAWMQIFAVTKNEIQLGLTTLLGKMAAQGALESANSVHHAAVRIFKRYGRWVTKRRDNTPTDVEVLTAKHVWVLVDPALAPVDARVSVSMRGAVMGQVAMLQRREAIGFLQASLNARMDEECVFVLEEMVRGRIRSSTNMFGVESGHGHVDMHSPRIDSSRTLAINKEVLRELSEVARLELDLTAGFKHVFAASPHLHHLAPEIAGQPSVDWQGARQMLHRADLIRVHPVLQAVGLHDEHIYQRQ